MTSEESLEHPSQHVVACEGCGSSVSVNWYCKNCPGSLCDNCKTSHKTTGLTKRHSVVPRTDTVVRLYGPAKIAEECRIHLGKEIVTYCNDCKVACCVSCQVENHKRHDICLIEDKYLTAEKRLNDYTKDLETNVKSKLKDMQKQIQSEAAKANQCANVTEAEVNSYRLELKQAVDEGCDVIIQSVKSPSKALDSVMKDLDTRLQNVEELIDKIGARIRDGKLSLVEYFPPAPDTLIPTITVPTLQGTKFVPDRELLNTIKSQLGTCASDNLTRIRQDGLSIAVPIFDRSNISVQKITSFKSEKGVTSVVIAGNNVAWLADFREDTLCMYNNGGKKIRSVTVQKQSGINDSAIKPSGEIIVSNTDKKLRSVTSKGNVSTLVDLSPVFPDGICLNLDDEIVVCIKDAENKDNYLAVYSSDGRRKLREIRVQDAQGKQLITSPYRVIKNGENLCLLNNCKNVICLDREGDLQWVYNGTQAKLESPFYPWGMCIDKYHNLLITDHSNSCVHYIDRKGQLIQVILTQKEIGLTRHWGIGVDDETAQVWVGNSVKDVVIARYLK